MLYFLLINTQLPSIILLHFKNLYILKIKILKSESLPL